jgi:uncharacterized protein with PIN domain
MTREDIIRMAREAGFSVLTPAECVVKRGGVYTRSDDQILAELERFAALVIAHREAQSIHSCGPDCQKPLCVNRRREIEAAVEAEREACAEIADSVDNYANPMTARDCAEAIRARGSK